MNDKHHLRAGCRERLGEFMHAVEPALSSCMGSLRYKLG